MLQSVPTVEVCDARNDAQRTFCWAQKKAKHIITIQTSEGNTFALIFIL